MTRPYRALTAALVALVSMSLCTACTDDYGTTDPAPVDAPSVAGSAVSIERATGTMSLRLDPSFADRTGARLTAAGPGTDSSGGAVELPISSGQVAASDATVAGVLEFGGSRLALVHDGTTVEFTDLVVDLGGAVSGSIRVDGEAKAQHVLLMRLGFLRPDLSSPSTVELKGTTVILAGQAAAALDEETDGQRSSDGTTLGAADITIRER